MVVANVVSGRKDIVALFWENKLGIDVDDNYRIVVFEGGEHLNMSNNHLILGPSPDRPGDYFLRLHFQECLAVSVCRGNLAEDYEEQELGSFLEEVGFYDDEMDDSNPKWSTSLGILVRAHLIRERMAHWQGSELVE